MGYFEKIKMFDRSIVLQRYPQDRANKMSDDATSNETGKYRHL